MGLRRFRTIRQAAFLSSLSSLTRQSRGGNSGVCASGSLGLCFATPEDDVVSCSANFCPGSRLNKSLSAGMQDCAMMIRSQIMGCMAAFLAMAGATAKDLDQNMVSKQHCRWLVQHQPATDVAYTPGVGVRGRPVKPADLASNRRINLPQMITIPLHVPVGNLLKKCHTPGREFRGGCRVGHRGSKQWQDSV